MSFLKSLKINNVSFTAQTSADVPMPKADEGDPDVSVADEIDSLKQTVYDDSGLVSRISAAETALGERYTKTETDTEIDERITEALATFDKLDFKIADAVPTATEVVIGGKTEQTSTGVRYLVKHETDDRYEEYILVDGVIYDIGSTDDGKVEIVVDQTYSSSSTNPQSGKAVAQAINAIPVTNQVRLAKNAPSTNAVIKFGRDAGGNYGYIKAGADTVTPFKSGLQVSPGSVKVYNPKRLLGTVQTVNQASDYAQGSWSNTQGMYETNRLDDSHTDYCAKISPNGLPSFTSRSPVHSICSGNDIDCPDGFQKTIYLESLERGISPMGLAPGTYDSVAVNPVRNMIWRNRLFCSNHGNPRNTNMTFQVIVPDKSWRRVSTIIMRTGGLAFVGKQEAKTLSLCTFYESDVVGKAAIDYDFSKAIQTFTLGTASISTEHATLSTNFVIQMFYWSPGLIFVAYWWNTAETDVTDSCSAAQLRALVLDTNAADPHLHDPARYRITGAITVGTATVQTAGTDIATDTVTTHCFTLVPLTFSPDCNQFGVARATSYYAQTNSSGAYTACRSRVFWNSLRVLGSTMALRTTAWTTVIDCNTTADPARVGYTFFDYVGLKAFSNTNATNRSRKWVSNYGGSYYGAEVVSTNAIGFDTTTPIEEMVNIIGQLTNGLWVYVRRHNATKFSLELYSIGVTTRKEKHVAEAVVLQSGGTSASHTTSGHTIKFSSFETPDIVMMPYNVFAVRPSFTTRKYYVYRISETVGSDGTYSYRAVYLDELDVVDPTADDNTTIAYGNPNAFYPADPIHTQGICIG